ncbi:MAG: transposase [Sphingorhabdus sp.]|uniref:transposase n=1 Tax=Sphingorhabdus sp. TaxID=1902408 RepID=UPI0038FC180F
MFPDDAASRKWLEDIRWPDGERFCPHCGSLKTTPVKNEIPMPLPRVHSVCRHR